MNASGSAEFLWRGYRLQLLAERAIWDPQQGLLLVADLHLGKAESFQSQGIPLPSDGDGATFNALLALAQSHRPAQVLVLGDLIHSRLGLTADLRQKLGALPDLLGCPLRLIGGNHERGCWLEGLEQEPSLALGPLWLSHAPEPRAGLLNLCGHRHPVALIGGGADRLRLPCFAYDPSAEQLVLPAFGQLTGGHPCPPDEVLWLVAEGTVVPWSTTPPRTGLSPRRPGPAPRRRG
ncbi:MAG: ligase-associated DNA damage response endonuclease PdeM [Aphanothece saxicola GSE-SYN-MK-01-06B]|jgi:DNA ligase-associated metallophosphoesterase|nr:ligase-associated DNA damage response endonuclease PdeM [Aphanothece saxicola GSE-SYN-MK-01-06B]